MIDVFCLVRYLQAVFRVTKNREKNTENQTSSIYSTLYMHQMVHPEGVTSNTIFDELEQWEVYLKSEGIDIHILENCGEYEKNPSKSRLSEEFPSESCVGKSKPHVRRLRGPSL